MLSTWESPPIAFHSNIQNRDFMSAVTDYLLINVMGAWVPQEVHQVQLNVKFTKSYSKLSIQTCLMLFGKIGNSCQLHIIHLREKANRFSKSLWLQAYRILVFIHDNCLIHATFIIRSATLILMAESLTSKYPKPSCHKLSLPQILLIRFWVCGRYATIMCTS
jgi:hypothetical protein